ncbi:MAG: HAD family hydrolase [bacterium]|nr:HAD family hydrolase [Actinomycetes bacterium]MCP4222220.1 HAD family hydrolase [Actinomycetes bacterium]MCP4968397.1 HAD family hydrolase [bacterium]
MDLAVVVVSNIDRQDIEAAIALHGLSFADLITSDDVRSYKPRPELFNAGLRALGLRPDQVLHIGDSVTSDVAGATRLGIPVARVNRTGKARRDGIQPTYETMTLTELVPLIHA